MHYLFLSIACSVAAVAGARLLVGRGSGAFMLAAVAMLTGATASLVAAALLGQFAFIGFIDISFGLATGIALAMAVYYLLRAIEDESLLFPPSLVCVAMLVSIALAVLFFDGQDGLTVPTMIGLGVGSLALVLVLVGGSQPAEADAATGAKSPVVGSVFVLVIVAFVFLGVQAFAAVAMNPEEAGSFLLVAMGTCGLAMFGLAMRAKQPFESGLAAAAAGVGALFFGAAFLFIYALAQMPGWRAFGLAAFIHVALVAILGMALSRDKFRTTGYVGIAGAVAGAALVLLG
jgi:hypothetical protein